MSRSVCECHEGEHGLSDRYGSSSSEGNGDSVKSTVEEMNDRKAIAYVLISGIEHVQAGYSVSGTCSNAATDARSSGYMQSLRCRSINNLNKAVLLENGLLVPSNNSALHIEGDNDEHSLDSWGLSGGGEVDMNIESMLSGVSIGNS